MPLFVHNADWFDIAVDVVVVLMSQARRKTRKCSHDLITNSTPMAVDEFLFLGFGCFAVSALLRHSRLAVGGKNAK